MQKQEQSIEEVENQMPATKKMRTRSDAKISRSSAASHTEGKENIAPSSAVKKANPEEAEIEKGLDAKAHDADHATMVDSAVETSNQPAVTSVDPFAKFSEPKAVGAA